MKILAKFNDSGKATAFYCENVNFETAKEKQNLIADGCIEISESDYNKLLGNAGQGDNGTGYIYDKTAKTVVSAPAAPTPTAAEIRATKKAEIDTSYKAVFDSLAADLVLAVLANNTTAQDSIKADYKSAQDSYAAELGAL